MLIRATQDFPRFYKFSLGVKMVDICLDMSMLPRPGGYIIRRPPSIRIFNPPLTKTRIKMKTNILYFPLLVLLSSVSLCSCSNDDEPVVTATDGTTLTVTARADGFASTDGTAHTGTPQTDTPQTRASESGYTTTFVKGDQIGVFAVRDGSVITGCQNMPLTYNGTSWSGSAPVYKYADATYFAYYPYTASMNSKTSVDEIVTAFNATVTAATDQSTYAKYTACDLMTATAESPTSGTSLSFSFTHKMSLIEISLPVQKYKTTNGADAYEYSAPVLNPTFSLTLSGSGATRITPYYMGNGAFRYIVPAGTSGTTVSGAFNTADNKTIEYSKSSLSLSAGNYKRLNVTYDGAPSATPTERALAVGDFYYSDGGIVPGDTKTPPSGGCIGIVCWVGRDAFNEDPLLKRDYPGCTHGLVVALKEAGSMLWSNSYEYVQNWVKTENGNPYKDVVNLLATDKRCGYSNTLALKDYNAKKYNSAVGSNNDYRVLPIDAIEQYAVENPAPANSSGWYFPSVMELKYVCWGQGNGLSASGRNNLNTYISKVSGTVFGDDYCWSSTEVNNSSNAWGVNFSSGSVHGSSDKTYLPSHVRPLLAF